MMLSAFFYSLAYFCVLGNTLSLPPLKIEKFNHEGQHDGSEHFPSVRLVHQCKLTNKQNPFLVLPGGGWDNLDNQEMGHVMKISYEKCTASEDGDFLIPDNTLLTPVKTSYVQLESDLFSHFSNYTSTTARSINTDVSYATPDYKISGTFSWENKNVKENQIKEKSTISRVQLRYEMYKLKFQPDSELDPVFKRRILGIGKLIEHGKDSIYPEYLADMTIKDFGTHVTRSIVAGAILSKTDILKTNYVSKYKGDDTVITASASYSMALTFGLNVRGGYNQSNSNLNEYNNNCASQRVHAIGGKPFGADFTLNDWEKSLENNLVAVDRSGDPLYYVITPNNFQELTDDIVFKVRHSIKEAIHRYYSANIRSGCMNFKSPKFNDDANIDSGICDEPLSSYPFGGVFQTCYGDQSLCNNVLQANPLTGSYSCSQGFSPVRLQDALNQCKTICISALLIFRKCITTCSYYSLSWCAPIESESKETSYVFGGMFTSASVNPLTNSHTCPQSFLALKFGATATVCVALPNDVTMKSSLPFGGFFSCKNGNPLTEIMNEKTKSFPEYWSKACSPGYSSYLAVVDRLCQISYCVKSDSLSQRADLPLQRPPFIDLAFGPNETDISAFGFNLHNDSTIGTSNTSTNHVIIYSVVASVCCTFLLVLIIVGLYMLYVRRRGISPNYKSIISKNRNNAVVPTNMDSELQSK